MSDQTLPLELSCQDVARLREAGESFLFVDCREPDEAEICRIEGTTLVPMSTLGDRISEFAGSEDKRIVVHCHKGGRSYRVANWLRQQGYPHAQSMAGGIEGWALEIDAGMARY